MVGVTHLAALATGLSICSLAAAFHDYDPSTIETAIGFDADAAFTADSTAPVAQHVTYSLQHLRNMGNLVAEPSNITVEALKRRAVIGNDDRVEWSDSNWPYSAIGKVQWSNGAWCSGTLIGPRHVITARHCTPQNGEDVYIRFSPFFYDGETVYGGSYVNTYIYSTNTDGDCLYKEDWAIFILDDRLGDWQGYFGANYVDSSYIGRPLYNIGYPQDKGGNRPYRSWGSSMHYLGNCDVDGPMWTDTDVIGGQSGGPLWEDPAYVLGTLYGGSGTESVFASGQTLVNAIISTRNDFP